MATIKSYSDLEQSKKLGEILPIESADLHYCLQQRDVATGYEIGITPFIKVKEYKGKCNVTDVQPVWSLAALLDFMKDKIIFGGNSPEGWFCCYTIKNPIKTLTIYEDSLIDACYEMIIRLHEQKLL